ncbi:MAG TPA: 50S ribosomal protein L29 [Candidatus Pacearchaeota archaeon]|nr:MAG: 50S ribosomal protein L29 [Candidatus Pacearchaeota archaeon ex4484_31]HDI03053.1 50S ribosomal protein L29 [Candidatus Pacearchaeota archaeon]
MAIIRKKELERLTKEELEKKLKELEMEKMKLKAKKGQPTGKTKQIKEIKKVIARIHAQLAKR